MHFKEAGIVLGMYVGAWRVPETFHNQILLRAESNRYTCSKEGVKYIMPYKEIEKG